MWAKVKSEQHTLERKYSRNDELAYETTVVCFHTCVYICEWVWVGEFVSPQVYKCVCVCEQAWVFKGAWAWMCTL